MDPDDVARMLADLGSARRDQVSAPSDELRGRPVRPDTRAQQAILAEDVARRQRICKGPRDGAQAEKAAALKAWNTETSFDATGDTGDLLNRFNGQGHRVALRQRQHHQYDDRQEAAEARYGEERIRYLQERDAGGGANYVAARAPAASKRRLGTHTTPRTVIPPAMVPGGHKTRGNVPINRTRAPSPRSMGTVRFGPGGKRIEAASSSSTSNGLTNTPSATKRQLQATAQRQAAATAVPVTLSTVSGQKRTQAANKPGVSDRPANVSLANTRHLPATDPRAATRVQEASSTEAGGQRRQTANSSCTSNKRTNEPLATVCRYPTTWHKPAAPAPVASSIASSEKSIQAANSSSTSHAKANATRATTRPLSATSQGPSPSVPASSSTFAIPMGVLDKYRGFWENAVAQQQQKSAEALVAEQGEKSVETRTAQGEEKSAEVLVTREGKKFGDTGAAQPDLTHSHVATPVTLSTLNNVDPSSSSSRPQQQQQRARADSGCGDLRSPVTLAPAVVPSAAASRGSLTVNVFGVLGDFLKRRTYAVDNPVQAKLDIKVTPACNISPLQLADDIEGVAKAMLSRSGMAKHIPPVESGI